MPVKPKLFVGSSSEALGLAQRFRDQLSDVADGIVWNDAGEFNPTEATLESLIKTTDVYDFGLFLMTPDDLIETRGLKDQCARDNVLLEVGLFLGALGRKRTFVVIQKSEDPELTVKTPTDLAGINIPRFKQDDDEQRQIASISTAVRRIRLGIKREGTVKFKIKVGYWSFNLEEKCLKIKIRRREIERNAGRLVGDRLLLCGRKQNPKNITEDTSIARSSLREIFEHEPQDVVISITNKTKFKKVNRGDMVDVCLVFVPKSIDTTGAKTIADLLEKGAQIVFHGAIMAR